MWAPKKSMFKVLDIDNKQNLVGYTQAWEGPLLPVVSIPLEHFIELKRIYDEFPGHIWCISSETLGLHVWERYSEARFGTGHPPNDQAAIETNWHYL